ncbi:MAG: hypothetical protein R3221_11720 [Spongiibacter sp.]|nr:hypothetical protein [Spongiibacter sp.]
MATSKKSTTLGSINQLQQLQSELNALREKSIEVMEKNLQDIEKSIKTKSIATQKQRDLIAETRQKLATLDSKSRQHRRMADKLESATQSLQAMQSELAHLRSESIEQKLRIRREKAVLKAITGAEKALKAPAAAKKPAATTKKNDTKAAATVPATPVAKKVAARKPGKVTDISKAAANSPPAPAKKPATGPRAVRRRSNVPKHMSDIPSHPKNQADRLASLFDDY